MAKTGLLSDLTGYEVPGSENNVERTALGMLGEVDVEVTVIPISQRRCIVAVDEDSPKPSTIPMIHLLEAVVAPSCSIPPSTSSYSRPFFTVNQ